MSFEINRRRYDRVMYHPMISKRYYGHTGFLNFGYWTAQTRSQGQASRDLVEKLLGILPQQHGCILDVACGIGATTKYLRQHYRSSAIAAINISEKQLTTARMNSPNCLFALMDAAKLGFEASTFGTILCVEAAFHFKTREQFFQEAFRILRPGGNLLLSDVLFRRLPRVAHNHLPPENYVSSIKTYGDRLRFAGFTDIRIIDATKACWYSHAKYHIKWAVLQLLRGNIDPITFLEMLTGPLLGLPTIRKYILVAARKPM